MSSLSFVRAVKLDVIANYCLIGVPVHCMKSAKVPSLDKRKFLKEVYLRNGAFRHFRDIFGVIIGYQHSRSLVVT